MPKKLTNVHDALRRAQRAEQDNSPMVNANFKMDARKKEHCEQICAKNGTTFSAFMRQCADGLLADYIGPKEFKRIYKG